MAADPLVSALLSVLFDIDKGQTIECCWPPGALTAQEQRDVAFHAFPDNASMELRATSSVRDSSFLFTCRRADAADGGAAQPDPLLYG
jgi:hypothetical protein